MKGCARVALLQFAGYLAIVAAAASPLPSPWACFSGSRSRSGGDRVYVVGLFSESRGGIVRDPNWANETRVMKGDGETVLRQLGSRIVRYAVGGVVSLAASAGIIALFLS